MRFGLVLLLAACARGETNPTTIASASAAPTAEASAAPELRVCLRIDERITKAELKRQLDNLQQVAKQHDGNRSRESGGYAASVNYVVAELRDRGLSPRRDGFGVAAFEQLGPGLLEITQPQPRRFLPGRNRLRTGEFTPLSGSPPGEITAEVAAVGIDLGLGNRSESGCAMADFDDGRGGSRVSNRIALMQRGTCPFVEKVLNAQLAGARAAVVFNQGDTPARRGLMGGSLDGRGARNGIRIPALLTTTAVGEQLLTLMHTQAVELHLATDTATHVDHVDNVIVDIPGARPAEVLVIGAHLDSVPRGPGMNDNASGSAALIAIARELAGCRLERSVRLAWWGAEEEGLLGSTAYVASLDDTALRSVLGYINLDMIASPNHAYMLTDGDGSKTGVAAPGTSAVLERFFRDDFSRVGHTWLEVPYIGRSDDKPFFDAGVGVVMLGAGFDGKKTPAEVALFGGEAGRAYDACYHRSCDDMKNVDIDVMTTITRTVARAVQHFAVRGEAQQTPLP